MPTAAGPVVGAGVTPEDASAHLALLRKLHSRMVQNKDTDGEVQIMELIDVFKSASVSELTDPHKIERRNKTAAPDIDGLFDVEVPAYPPDFEAQLQSEAPNTELIRIRLDKGPERPLGFSLSSTASGVVVKELFPGTTASLDGNLRTGDRVVAIGPSVVGKSGTAHKEAVALLQQCAGVVDVWVARPRHEETFWRHLEAIKLNRSSPNEDLGLTIVPGVQPHEILVGSVAPGGVADQDGRLQAGDRILEVQRTNVSKLTCSNVEGLLMKKDMEVQMKIARMVSGKDPMAAVMSIDATDSSQSKVVTVELTKGAKGLGLTIAAYVGAEDTHGIFVKDIVPGTSAAEEDVQPLDQILEVNGVNITDKTNAQSLKLLKGTGPKAVLKLKRRLNNDSFTPRYREPNDAELIAKWKPRVLPWESVVVATVQKDEKGGLGLGVEGRGPSESDDSQEHHMVCSINPDGPVGRSGALKDGDRLLEVGGHDLAQCDHDTAVGWLKKAPASFKLVVARPSKEATTATDSAPLGSPKKVKAPVRAWKEPRDVTLTKEATTKLGFSILDYEHPDNEDEVVVLIRAVMSKSPAYGVLRENQLLVHVNGKSVEGMTMEEALPLLKEQAEGKVVIGIADPVESVPESSSSAETTDSQTVNIVVSHGEIELGLDLDVERGRHGVVVKSVLRNGAIAKDGRLAVGDRILAINSVSLDPKSPSLARHALHNASHSDNVMRVTFVAGPRHGVATTSEASSTGEDVTKTLSTTSATKSGTSPRLPRLSVYSEPMMVEVTRMASGGLGISIVGGNTEIEEEDGTMTRIKGIFIKHVLPDSPAGASGQLKSGDRVVEVDGHSMEALSHQEAVEVIRSAGNPVKLAIQTLPATMRESRKERLKREEQERLDASKREAEELDSLLAAAREKYTGKFDGHELRAVELLKGDQGLGIGLGTAADTKMIEIGDIRPGSSAASKLEIHDILVEVNGTETAHLSHPEVSNFIRSAPARLLAIMARKSVVKTPSASPAPGRAEVAKLKLTKDELREVTLVKPETGGLGLAISKHRTDESILFIKSINQGSVAAQNARIRRGDHVLEINGQSTADLGYAPAIAVLKEAKGEIKLVLGTLPPALLSSPPVSPTPDTAPANASSSISIELMKPATGGLGVSIVERPHPSQEGKTAIYVADVVMDGVAYKDGRLKAGNRIMSVNGVDMSEATQAMAVGALKGAVGKVELVADQLSQPASPTGGGSTASLTASQNTPRKPNLGALRSMTFDDKHRQDQSIETEEEPRRVVINREAGQSLGMSIAGGIGSIAGDVPIFIAGLQPEGLAASTKNIQVGDRVLEINSQSVLGMTRTDVVQLLRTAGQNVVLLVVRDTKLTTLDPKQTTDSITRREKRESEFRDVKLSKTTQGYGFSIVGGRDESGTDFPVYIKEVVEDGTADHSGELHRGDQLVAINAQKLEGLSCKEASHLIVDSQADELTLTLLS